MKRSLGVPSAVAFFVKTIRPKLHHYLGL
jgi:hypothetical protein